MKFAIRKVEPNGCARFICSHCGKTLFISDGTAPIDLPEVCGHCGRDVYFMGNDFEEEHDE
jgi:hypothetical protein